MPDKQPQENEEVDRQKRFVDDSADHWKVGPKTQEAAKKIKGKKELDALIPLAPDEES